MSEPARVRAIPCARCGAPLSLHGGHRVRSVTCSYCGAVMDPRDDYTLLQESRRLDVQRNHLPLRLGMRGRLNDVEFTVIGFVTYGSAPDAWTEFCLFSPTHGYAWLSYEDGHFVLAHRVRILPTPTDWRHLEPKARIQAGGKRYRFYDAYPATIVDVAGELPWIAGVDDRIDMADAIAPPHILCRERSGQELEFSRGEYLPLEQIQTAFLRHDKETSELAKGTPLADLKPPRGVHPAQPYVPSPPIAALGKAGLIFTPVALLLALVVGLWGSGQDRLTETFRADQLAAGAISRTFEVQDADKLVEVDLAAPVNNSWTWFDMTVLKDQQEVFSLGKEISYYHGYEGGEHWSEGSVEATALFRVPEPGRYAIRFEAGEGDLQGRSLSVRIREGVMLVRWYLWLAALSAVALALPYLRKGLTEMKRWQPVTGDDDE